MIHHIQNAYIFSLAKMALFPFFNIIIFRLPTPIQETSISIHILDIVSLQPLLLRYKALLFMLWCLRPCRNEVLIDILVDTANWYQVNCVPNAFLRHTIDSMPYCSRRTSTSSIVRCMSPGTALIAKWLSNKSKTIQFPKNPSVIFSSPSSLVQFPDQKYTDCNQKTKLQFALQDEKFKCIHKTVIFINV